MAAREMSAAATAFGAIAGDFDARFGAWRSVAAQRRAIRTALLTAFPEGSRLIEIGGGTGEDALWLARHGRRVLMTDPSPEMVRVAGAKFEGTLANAALASAERLPSADGREFDGAYSIFAALNCVADLPQFGRELAGLLPHGSQALLVTFGTFCPGEWLVEAVRGRPRNMLRRFQRKPVMATLGGQRFAVHYHRRADLEGALSPWFELEARQGIGVFVPPSAAEPWISGHPRLLRALETLDRRLSRPLAPLGDHILYRFRRTDRPVAEP